MGRSFKRILRRSNKISDCQPMCPWCGSDDAGSDRLQKWYNYKCRKCSHDFCSYNGWVFLYLGTVFCIYLSVNLFRTYGMNSIPAYITGILSFAQYMWFFVYLDKMPYKRAKNSDYIPEEFLGLANITWLPQREGGLRLPNLTIWNHYILGVCFIDEKGNPISQTGYIRVNKMLFKKTRRIYRITDNFQYDKEHMTHFAVFYQQRRVGTGNMILSCRHIMKPGVPK